MEITFNSGALWERWETAFWFFHGFHYGRLATGRVLLLVSRREAALFFSDLEGFRCIWAQRLDPATKQPEGPAFAVRHCMRLAPRQQVSSLVS